MSTTAFPATDPILAAPAPATRAERLALRLVQVAAVLVVLVAVTWREYELDRFFVPKELVLHVAALCSGALLVRSVRRIELTRIDVLLGLFLGLSALSAAFAPNGWLAVRALAVTASGVVLFWSARILAAAGLGRPVVHAAALAAGIGVLTAALQTYGVQTDLFSINRAPGGTLGNRNFIAHMAAFALPAMLLMVLRTHSHLRYVAAAAGATMLIAMLVLTRSRAGLLALAAVAAVFVLALLVAPALRRSLRVWVRLVLLLVIAAAGVTAAVIMPNSLRWRGDNPYMESLTGVANYQDGSGRGRLVQYRQSARMAASHPLLGVGPGNWSVRYPAFATANDPSLDRRQPGTTSNPWPSSDWMAFVSERGLIAAIAFALALLSFALSGVRRLRAAAESEDAAGATALIATIAALGVAGMFDAVLLLGHVALLAWLVIGALWNHPADRAGFPRSRAMTALFAGAIFLSLTGAARSGAQLAAMGIDSNAGDLRSLQRAVRLDPGNYRVRLQLARPGSGLQRAGRCEHALAARAMFPEARQARNLARGCGD